MADCYGYNKGQLMLPIIDALTCNCSSLSSVQLQRRTVVVDC